MEKNDDSRKELIEGLKKAAQGNSRNKTAQLREIFDEVEAAKKSGLSLKTIVAVLADRGLIFDLATFVNVRHRIKKERFMDAFKSTAPSSTFIKTEFKDVSVAHRENNMSEQESEGAPAPLNSSSDELKAVLKKEVDINDFQ